VERLGIFGGTFDPVHVGHLAAACSARYQLQLDRVLMMVAPQPWQKEASVVAPPEVRYEMVEAAIDGYEGLEASRLELDRSGPTYTIDTIELLRAHDREPFFIVGADTAAGLDSWKRASELKECVTIVIVERDGVPSPAPPDGWRVERVRMPRLDISSTDLRRRIAAGEPVEFLIPLPAVRVLRAHSPYTSS
jgi:nicotinate-nucleotide adenylyltransferase